MENTPNSKYRKMNDKDKISYVKIHCKNKYYGNLFDEAKKIMEVSLKHSPLSHYFS